ncbi:hypothetical protein BD779DRAFT_80864 [Infundibulicybe gibba]|nr:hypothetical protein BD779DRAFT_80864 [Infundibulicybe gibba]
MHSVPCFKYISKAIVIPQHDPQFLPTVIHDAPHSESTRRVARLPYEIERMIFELVSNEHPDMIPSLILVARRVQVWIQPMLYDSVTLYEPKTAEKFLLAVEAKPSFCATHVKKLCLSGLVRRDHAERILHVCTGLTHLASWPVDSLSLKGITDLQPQHLSLNATRMDSTTRASVNFRLPLFSHVTHLEITDHWSAWSTWSGFDSMPYLTHLGFRLGNDKFSAVTPVLHDILDSCPRLEVLLILVAGSPCPSLAWKVLGDNRCVCLPCDRDRSGDWEATVKGESDRWAQATAIMHEQQSKSD